MKSVSRMRTFVSLTRSVGFAPVTSKALHLLELGNAADRLGPPDLRVRRFGEDAIGHAARRAERMAIRNRSAGSDAPRSVTGSSNSAGPNSTM